MTVPQGVVRFAGFEFDTSTGELRGPDGTTRLQPQPAKVLAALVARPGELVTREELKKVVWPDTVVEADQGLNFCVRQIRTALNDEAESARYIETLPRRGYRFVAPIDVAAAAAPRRSRRVAVIALIAVLVLIEATLSFRDIRASRPVSVAILPFAAAEEKPWTIPVAGDVTDQLVEKLTNDRSRKFGVVGPVTTKAFLRDSRPHTVIGKDLGVDYMISGGVRVSDSTLFVQAIRVSDGTHVVAWRERVYDRDAREIAAKIVAALRKGF